METLHFNRHMQEKLNDALLEHMERESEFITDALISLEIVEEAVGDKIRGGVDKIKELIQKFKTFMAKIFGVFKKKVEEIVSSDIPWLNKHEEALKKADYTKLSLEMAPYWKVDQNRLFTMIGDLVTNKIKAIHDQHSRSKEGSKNATDLMKSKFPDLVDENGDLKEGLKNYLRTGNSGRAKAEPVKIEGKTMESIVVGDMLEYCKNYKSGIVGKLQAEQNIYLRYVESFQSSYNKNSSWKNENVVKEHFCLIENAVFGDTELMFCRNAETLLEAEVPSDTQANKEGNKDKSVNKDGDKEASHKTVKVESKDGKGVTPANEAVNIQFYNSLIGLTNLCFTVAMTIVEERYHAYIKALKAIVSQLPKEEKETNEEKPDKK